MFLQDAMTPSKKSRNDSHLSKVACNKAHGFMTGNLTTPPSVVCRSTLPCRGPNGVMFGIASRLVLFNVGRLMASGKPCSLTDLRTATIPLWLTKAWEAAATYTWRDDREPELIRLYCASQLDDPAHASTSRVSALWQNDSNKTMCCMGLQELYMLCFK